VRVQLFGSSALINSIKPGQVQVRVDLKKSAEGANIFPISQENIVLPPGVFLNKVQPSTIEVTLDVPATKELSIQVDWVGRLPDNLFLVKSEVTPGTVKVIGGRKILEKVNTIYTTPVRLDPLTKSGSLVTAVVLSPPSLKLASGAPERITVVYTLEDRVNEGQQ
jgi:diadenylate cyclase